MNAGPEKGHKTTLVAKRVEIVGEVLLIIIAAQLAWRSYYKRRRQTKSLPAQHALERLRHVTVIVPLMIGGHPAAPGARRFHAKLLLEVLFVSQSNFFGQEPAEVVVNRKRLEVARHVVGLLQNFTRPLAHHNAHHNKRRRHAGASPQLKQRGDGLPCARKRSLAANTIVGFLVSVYRQEKRQVLYLGQMFQVRGEQRPVS